MKSFVVLKNEHRAELPPEMRGQDIRYGENLVEYFLSEFTKEGDIVFDPFAGFGTTLQVAEAMNRVPYGLEANEQRIAYARTQLKYAENLVYGDARLLDSYPFPTFDFSITSPPYMGNKDKQNPFTDYSTKDGDYEQYLVDIGRIYEQMGRLMKSTARAVIEVSNLKGDEGLTMLAWDIANQVSKVLSIEGEIVIGWDKYGYGYEHSYCLVFKGPGRL